MVRYASGFDDLLRHLEEVVFGQIARIEGADRRRVWESIRRGLKKLAWLLDTAQ